MTLEFVVKTRNVEHGESYFDHVTQKNVMAFNNKNKEMPCTIDYIKLCGVSVFEEIAYGSANVVYFKALWEPIIPWKHILVNTEDKKTINVYEYDFCKECITYPFAKTLMTHPTIMGNTHLVISTDDVCLEVDPTRNVLVSSTGKRYPKEWAYDEFVRWLPDVHGELCQHDSYKCVDTLIASYADRMETEERLVSMWIGEVFVYVYLYP